MKTKIVLFALAFSTTAFAETLAKTEAAAVPPPQLEDAGLRDGDPALGEKILKNCSVEALGEKDSLVNSATGMNEFEKTKKMPTDAEKRQLAGPLLTFFQKKLKCINGLVFEKIDNKTTLGDVYDHKDKNLTEEVHRVVGTVGWLKDHYDKEIKACPGHAKTTLDELSAEPSNYDLTTECGRTEFIKAQNYLVDAQYFTTFAMIATPGFVNGADPKTPFKKSIDDVADIFPKMLEQSPPTAAK